MDINLELYKVFYYVATSLSFSEACRSTFYLSVCSQPVDQNTGKKAESHTFYPKHKKVPLTPEGELLLPACQTGITDAG